MRDAYTDEDIQMVKRIILGYVPSSVEMLAKYDLNNDGKINATDIAYIKQKIKENAQNKTRDPESPKPYAVGTKTLYTKIGTTTFYWQYEADGKWHLYSQSIFQRAAKKTGTISDTYPRSSYRQIN